jgi:hypothetical protein
MVTSITSSASSSVTAQGTVKPMAETSMAR